MTQTTRGAILLGVRGGLTRRRLTQVAAALERGEPGVTVAPAFIAQGKAGADPLLVPTVARLVEAGVSEIAVIPFIADWEFPEHYDLPQLLAELAEDYPHVRYFLGRTLSAADDVVDVLAGRLAEAWGHPDAATARPSEIASIADQSPLTTAMVKEGELPKLAKFAQHLFVCTGRTCMEHGASDTYRAIMQRIQERELDSGPERVLVSRTRCLWPSAGAPVLCHYPSGTFFSRIDSAAAVRFVDEVLVQGGTMPGHAFTAAD